jgi:UDP-2-acetamido-3-amino-2,3-dideoxy-glucuronate N-acetyltransferase
VVGAGYWGKNHIKILNEVSALGGIVDSNPDVLNKYSEELSEIKTFLKLDDALLNNDFAGFTVATPADTHFRIAKKIIEARKHILIEKPLALNIEDAEQLIKLANENNINLMVGHLLLFHPAIKKIKKLIKTEKIGKLQYIYSNRLNLGQVRTEESVFWSLAPHDVSIFQYFTDSYPDEIIAKGSSFLQKGIHDYTITQLKYPTNVEGHIFVSWLHPFKEHRLVVIGSEAMITFEDSAEGKPLKLYSKKYNFKNGLPEKIDGPVDIVEYENKMPLTEELYYFTKHLNSKKLAIANAQHALEVTKILVEASNQIDN